MERAHRKKSFEIATEAELVRQMWSYDVVAVVASVSLTESGEARGEAL